METVTQAPDFPPDPNYPRGGYPSRGRKLGPAWNQAWTQLTLAITGQAGEGNGGEDGWLDGRALAAMVAADNGLAEMTMVSLFGRAAVAGLLIRKDAKVKGTRGTRVRTHYAIAPEYRDAS